VINGGVQGYGPVEEWLFYDRVAAAFEPDLVLLVAFVGNDAIEAADAESKLDAGEVVIGAAHEQAVSLVRRVVRSSMVLQLARLRVDQLSARLSGPGHERPLESYLDDPTPVVTRGLAVSRRAFGQVASRASASGARAAMVLMPARFQTDDGDFGRLADRIAWGSSSRATCISRRADIAS
jgi:hypothetical protein